MDSVTRAICAPDPRRPSALPAESRPAFTEPDVAPAPSPIDQARAGKPRSNRMRQAIRSLLAGVSLALVLVGVAFAETNNYTVQPGDTLNSVADRFSVRAGDLATANDLANADALQIGQTLRLPNGADVRPAPATRGNRPIAPVTFGWPLRGTITTEYGERGPYWSKGYHPGLDIGAPLGTPIGACADGVVIEADWEGWNRGYGHYVKIDHGNGLISLYGHMANVAISVGDKVSAGTYLGRVGMTGFTTGPHVHWEVRVNGQTRDPLAYLP